ncbi:hypothetical protein MKL09_31240 [Methylobacterium sp. J-048]|uniref:hypothetical protein n=1 Tax=Methylobacterium sp. J-048 TaxID=2836635 RepID=UPI001FBBCC36|nr:hypothetical protein [Methylobacterium sp. J-048]MCJ2060981.1 hypothetical protein [Methylobacterium sp. J-048]
MTRRRLPRSTALTNKGGVRDPSDIDRDPPERLTDEERAAAQRGLADLRAGRFATTADVEAAYHRFRPQRLDPDPIPDTKR